MNLVPTRPGKTPSYWCTWGAQNYASDHMDDTSWKVAYNNLDEAMLFDQPGWATCCFDAVRPDLYLLFDVGWDAPAGADIETERWRLGSLEVDTGRFPSCTGTPPERLAQLNRLVQSAGWRGAAIWVAPFAVGEGKDNFMLAWDALEEYYRQRMQWSRAAGIGYWKVDTGLRGEDVEFRRMLTRIAAQEAPDLVIEHALPLGPLNDESTPWDHFETDSSGRYHRWNNGQVLSTVLELVSFSNVVRTYDVTNQLSVATTLDRVAALLSAAPAASGMGLLNAENELYLAAALGCAFGAMRHPDWRDVPGTEYDPYLWRKRSDEVLRAARWQRIAPAVSAASGAHLSMSSSPIRGSFGKAIPGLLSITTGSSSKAPPPGSLGACPCQRFCLATTASCPTWSVRVTPMDRSQQPPCRAPRRTGASSIRGRTYPSNCRTCSSQWAYLGITPR
jgi:hypothetical protein